ncbi:phytase [Arthrobacter sp. AK04]|uniref:phytase n=1 Tax=Arthrobacter sp. AK04 TaxID=2900048 RepID=UPI001E4622DE|nr:phytase [Arthrobacter sp. AK04]MCD5344056.1 phytase [Arthrobacter sp. AK04]
MLRLFRIIAALMVAIATLVAFTLLTMAGRTAVAASTTVTLTAVADTYISTASPNSNFGRAKTLAVSDSTLRALLRFNVTLPAGSSVTNITLRLYSNTSVSGSLVVHPASDSWSETTVTANNQPAWQTAELARSGLLRARQYASAALPTNAVTGSGNFNLGVDTTAGVQGSLDSREGAKRPQLVITYDSPSTPTPTPTPTPTSTATPTPTSTAPGSAPQNIRLDPAYTTDLEHTARFLWDPVPNATTYRHYINGVAVAGEDDTGASETVRNLQPATAYTFLVGAFVGGIEYKSAPFNFTTVGTSSTPTPTPTSTATPTPTPTSTAPGSAPKNIRLDPAYTTDLEHTARFLWDPVPNATIYRHYINGVAIAGEDDTSTGETVGNLQPANAYTFSVGAFIGGIEYKSAPFSFTTAGASPTPTPTSTATAPVVLSALETESFSGSGDISDDSAIWVDQNNPANSAVVADKKSSSGGGIGVFGMDGKLIHFRSDGMIGNVDLRTGFSLGGNSVVLVGANNRTNNTLALYTLNTATRTLTPVAARSIATFSPNYGFCLYRSSVSGKFYAFVTPYVSGNIQQFELFDNGAGLVDATLVRSIPINSITEGCVADDGLGHLYIAQEDVALWKYGAEPGTGSSRVSVDTAGGGRLVADIEGLSIEYGPSGTGRIFVSSQGDSTIALYDRAGNNAFLTKFSIGASGTVDAVTRTDGLDVTPLNAGPQFENGLLVVHDEENTGSTASNLKYIPLSSVPR